MNILLKVFMIQLHEALRDKGRAQIRFRTIQTVIADT